MPESKDYRKFLRTNLWLEMRGMRTDQQQGVPAPPVQKPYPDDATLIDLPGPDEFDVGAGISVSEAIANRQSRRRYTDEVLTIEELAFLCWATQGVHKVWRDGVAVRRTVPSAGARHAFETYLSVNRVEDLEPGLYRYLSIEHKLLLQYTDRGIGQRTAAACHNQGFVTRSAVTFIWTALPYRTEWRYALMTPKLVNLDAGHVCENLYLAVEAVGAGTCAIAAYNQQEMDHLLRVDGEDEFAVYVAPVGKV